MRVLIAASEDHHGAVVHARQVAALVAGAGVEVVTEGPAEVAHAQFTDALWGVNIEAAAAAYERWATSLGVPVVVTMHDLPGADADRRRDARRSAGYARVAAASEAVIVSSHHEAAKVTRLSGRAPRFIELPLPVFEEAALGGQGRFDCCDGPSLGVLGFVYPGKGHEEAIDAAGRQTPVPSVISLGAVSPPHLGLRLELERHAVRRGVRLVITGSLPEAAWVAAAGTVAVPLAPNRAVSASASLLAWIGCGRRPLCAPSEYSLEFSRRHPGLIDVYDSPEGLDQAIRAAIVEPERTRLNVVGRWPDVGAQHVEAYRAVLGEAKVPRA